MTTDIPPFDPDPRPGTLPDPAVPPFGPGTLPDDDDIDPLPDPDNPGDIPRQPPRPGPFPEGPPPDADV
ncbi:hypothetical protein PRN20_04305 [Devosia sp. ZB163]|uniref:hypothetical protein n=1 Tax=Devosia sp. ZB163 TaxID=3025938 RepID=UPI00235DDF3C|nr:hypothetical protein [Devosia sp. ZB163]MDC9822944.1 hypothetical protein [Devosia sp. ZB163]